MGRGPFQNAPQITIGAVALLTLAALAGRLDAQNGGARIVGSARSADGERVVGAEVRVAGSASRGAITREDGTFELTVAGDSLPRLIVRRIGFRPESVTVALPQAASPVLVVQLHRTAQVVRPVVVSASRALPNTTMAQVRERERTAGNGYFAFREDFSKYSPVVFTDILRRIPGVQTVRTPGNAATVRLRENRCTPLFWLDGQALLGIPFDPNSLPATTIEAVEVYSAPSLVPPQFQGPYNVQGCGSVVIWTRQGEFRARRPRIGADSIARLLDSQRIFEVTEVDTPARITVLPEPLYPDSLLAAGVGGSALIEFIVDANGSINTESIGIVAATHTLFADAVRIAVLEAEFVAARRRDRAVAQLYQLPVTFAPPKRP